MKLSNTAYFFPVRAFSEIFFSHSKSINGIALCGQASAMVLAALLTMTVCSRAQVNVLTAHNDIARTGQNTNETILTPSNVNGTQFGKLFSQNIGAFGQAQPLYVSGLTIPGKGKHNVVYAGTSQDMMYAFDADSNGGSNAAPLWKTSFLATLPAGAKTNDGVVGTPVIDLSTNTMYVVTGDYSGGVYIDRIHALDITTGAEKFGGPVQLEATIAGTGSGSSGGKLTFDAEVQVQRPGLLLLNGVVYVALGSQSDNGPWHGWIFSYNAANLKSISVFCTSPNGSGDGIWMGGTGLAAEVNDPTKPYGRMFFATGNGSYSATKPFNATMSYGMSVLTFDLNGGVPTPEDMFTPYNETTLNAEDGDVGSGGVVLLPTQTLPSGKSLTPLLQVGKSGIIYILDRNNLGGFNPNYDNVEQEVQTPVSGSNGWGLGMWGSVAYWNNNVYFGGTTYAPTGDKRNSNTLSAYSFVNGRLSTTPTSQTTEQFAFPGGTPSVSSNGNTNGIVWVLKNDAYTTLGDSILLAFDATNLGNQLYSSADNPARDNPGPAVKFTVPTIANGKVYVMTDKELSVYGLLTAPVASAPVFVTPPGSFTGSISITISDATPGAQIYYTVDGVTSLYNGPFNLTSSEVITAYASANGYLQSPVSSASYTSLSDAAPPAFSLAPGGYSGTQLVALSDSSPGAKIYYTLVPSTPTSGYTLYTQPLEVQVSETIQAYATAPNVLPSSVVSAAYTVTPAYQIYYPNGFADADGPVKFNGSTDLDDFRLQLTDGGLNEAGSAFYTKPVNIQSFTTDFTFQLSNPAGDGITFAIQTGGATALGASGENLGYADIPNSVAIKFDIHSDNGESPNSTGIYLDGALPTLPDVDLTGTGINLHSGDYIDAHITYDGTTLSMTLTDAVTLATWSHAFTVNIPQAIGSNTAYVGFTGSTGAVSASQKLTYWTYLAGRPTAPNFPAGFDFDGLTMTGGPRVTGTRLRLTDGGTFEAHSVFFTLPVSVQQFNTSFDFQLTNAEADGFTFSIQGSGAGTVGSFGADLGYATNTNSLAVKFDLHNNSGEGTNSTGLYTKGAAPTVPSTSLTSSGVNLHSGDTIHVQMTYDGTTLTVTITDTVTKASATQTYTVNIPAVVGGPIGYVGFTASTGAETAIQDILDWTYSPTF